MHAVGRIDFAIAQAPEDAWERHSCGAGAKGPRVYDWAAARLPAIDDFDGDEPTHDRWVLARRSLARIYVALAVTTDGRREILGLWAGDGGEGANHWLHILTEIKNRGVSDVLMLVCDGLKGLPEAVKTVWPRTIVQTCVVHLLRNSFRYAARQDWYKIAKLLKPVYTAPTRGGRPGQVRRVRRRLGQEIPGDREAVGERVGGVHSIPAVRHRDPSHRLHDERDRVGQRPYPAGGQGPRALPERAGRVEVRLHGDHVARPHVQGPGPLDHALEDRSECLRHHLRRPPLRSPSVTPTTAVTQLVWPCLTFGGDGEL